MTTSQYKKLLPAISGETRPYWDACARGDLLVQRCGICGKYQFYPRGFCSHCWSQRDLQWVKSSGKGLVWSYTITRQNRMPGYNEEVPYVLALVELEEGVRMFTNIVGCKPEEVAVGMPVEVTFVRAAEGVSIPYFKPAKARSA
ncbi:MAG: Zn-ribbon domain-containing OB-fold protein [Chloroflexi bacterium]|nr:Zn-ribbon domain-containing OB-fold protein [Chloroflexota bacterium]